MMFEEVSDKEVDQWITNPVFKILRRSGAPLTRSMSMRWILTWKEAPQGTKAKSRLVANGFAGPDILTIRAEAPTLCNWLAPISSTLEVGDMSTAFLQGEKINIIVTSTWDPLQISEQDLVLTEIPYCK